MKPTPIACDDRRPDGKRTPNDHEARASASGPRRAPLQAAPDRLLDACLAFAPALFEGCPSLPGVRAALASATRLDFHLGSEAIPDGWATLREEARERFAELTVGEAPVRIVQTPGG